jgi:hypothetical protein
MNLLSFKKQYKNIFLSRIFLVPHLSENYENYIVFFCFLYNTGVQTCHVLLGIFYKVVMIYTHQTIEVGELFQ